MALRFRHINTQQTLNTIKFSADSTNTTYFLHSSPSTQIQGTPDVKYVDICFIKPTGQVYTHGKLYNGENNNNFTDSFANYLNELHSRIHTNIILTGGNWFELSTTKKVSPGFVYIHTVGIVYVDNKFLTEIPFPQSGEPCIYRYTYNENYESLPKKDWNYEYSYTEFSNPNPDYYPNFHIEKVCDWSDLKHLYKISIENASQLRDGLMSKEDKIKLDNGYLDYLHKLCTDSNKNAIILSGGEKYENGIRKAFVYINNIGIKSILAIYSGSFTINTDYKIILYTTTGYYQFKSSTYNLNDNEELVCDWSDLARLSDLEVPIATEYQNGLVKVDSVLSSSSTNPIANSAVADKLLFINNIYFKENGNRVANEYILLCAIKFTYNSGAATLYWNQVYNVGQPNAFKADILYNWSSVSVSGGSVDTVDLKAEITNNKYIKIYLKFSYQCTGGGSYTILGNLREIIPNDAF